MGVRFGMGMRFWLMVFFFFLVAVADIGGRWLICGGGRWLWAVAVDLRCGLLLFFFLEVNNILF